MEKWIAECRMGMPSQADQSISEDVNSRFRVENGRSTEEYTLLRHSNKNNEKILAGGWRRLMDR